LIVSWIAPLADQKRRRGRSGDAAPRFERRGPDVLMLVAEGSGQLICGADYAASPMARAASARRRQRRCDNFAIQIRARVGCGHWWRTMADPRAW
jgi:hypothetical protein